MLAERPLGALPSQATILERPGTNPHSCCLTSVGKFRRIRRLENPGHTRNGETNLEEGAVPEEAVSIHLTGDQALVLFDWITRFDETGDPTFVDQAEQTLLWIIEGSLEKALVAPFAANYLELVAQARDRVRDPEA